MNRKFALARELKSYSAVAATFLVANQLADAQIIYTNIPDTSGTKHHFPHEIENDYFLDLNNDGVPDFEMISHQHVNATRYQEYQDEVEIVGLDSNEVAGNFYNASDFQSGEVIGPSANFLTGTNVLNGYYDHCGNCGGTTLGQWKYGQVEFLGLKIHSKGNTYYGWARVKTNYYSFVLYDYGYNSIPDSAVAAGDTSAVCFIPSPQLFTGYFCGDTAVSLEVPNYKRFKFQWLLNSNTIHGDTLNYLVADSTGSYTLLLVSPLGCTDTSNAFIFLQGEKPAVSRFGDTLFSNFNSGNQWVFYSSKSYTLIPGATNNFYTPAKSGSYSVEHTDTNTCILYSAPYNFIFTGVSDFEKLPGVDLVQENRNIRIEIPTPDLLPARLHIYDVDGREVFSREITDEQTSIDVSALAEGFYFAILENNRLKTAKKLILY